MVPDPQLPPSPAPGTVVEPEQEQRTREAPRYRVLIHNDDQTPMDFVVAILVGVFGLAEPQAVSVMYEAHHTGVALVAVYSFEQAEYRVDRAHSLARTRKWPLTFSIEPA